MVLGVLKWNNNGSTVPSRSVDVGTAIIPVELVNVSMVVDECTVSYHCCASFIGWAPADDKTSSKSEPSWIQGVSVVVERSTVVVMKDAVDDEQILALVNKYAAVKIIPEYKHSSLLSQLFTHDLLGLQKTF